MENKELGNEKMYSFTKDIRYHKVNEDMYIVWNRFFPNLLNLNKNAYQALKEYEGKSFTPSSAPGIANHIDALLHYKLIFQGEQDPYVTQFHQEIDAHVEQANKKAKEFYEKKLDYSQFYILNTICNLHCSYCARNFNSPQPTPTITPSQKKEILFAMIDEYIKSKIASDIPQVNFAFNGGEILLEWNLIKELAERNKQKYPELKFKYYINTNMTLMTEEISRFIHEWDIELEISIDGYPDAHNKTRQYADKTGSFAEVKRGLELYNKYNADRPIFGFQGTIDHDDSFIPEEVYKMKEFGFKMARLGPNLLEVNEEDVDKKVAIFKKFIELNKKDDFNVSDSFFEGFIKMTQTDNPYFRFHCNGLHCLPRLGIHVNLTSWKMSHICDYCLDAAVPIEKLNNDIYNPELWKTSYDFIRSRGETLKTKCQDCSIIGICRGSCIMLGLDNKNNKNDMACLFQEKMFAFFLDYYFGTKNKETEATTI